MMKTITTIFASLAVGAAIGFSLMYLAISRADDVSAPMPTSTPCAIGWGESRP